MKKIKRQRIQHWHKIAALLVLYDVFAVIFSYFFALWFRFDCSFSAIHGPYLTAFMKFAPIAAVICVVTFLFLKLYNSIWRFASFTELMRTAIAVGINMLLHWAMISLLFERMPISYFVFGSCMHLLLSLLVRFSYRFVLLIKKRTVAPRTDNKIKRIMLVGGGNAGQIILRDVNRLNKANMHICCIVDDNSNKWGRYIDGVLIAGGRHQIPELVQQYQIDQIFIAIPSATNEEKRDILDICKETG